LAASECGEGHLSDVGKHMQTLRNEWSTDLLRGRRLLIVDDHHDTARLLQVFLSSLGLEVHVAEGYAEAMKVAEGLDLDVLVSDLSLFDGDGCDLMRALRAKMGSLHGIAVTGCGLTKDRDRCREAGFTDFLLKPISLDDLEAAIRRDVARLETVKTAVQ
jgi:two-component system, chemotaxis family, CheB/CheR fusion protein